MLKKTTLPSKLRIVTQTLPHTKSVTVMILVGAGSRYETLEINGIAHFLEHMFFKGGQRYQNTKEVSQAIDKIGGEFNAFTGKEYAGYFVKVSADKVDIAIDVLSDMLLNAKFDSHEIEKERGVILEEYNMYQDTPMYQIGWDFEQLIYGKQPLGLDQIGSKELIKTVTQKQFKSFKNQLYTPDNTVICIAGNIEHQAAVEKIQKHFTTDTLENQTKSYDFKPLEPHTPPLPFKITNKKTEQAHLVTGFKTISFFDPLYWTSKVLATLLGGTMSSRIFLNVREAQGLCYYVRTETDSFTDTGTFSTRAGVDTTRVTDAMQAILQEYRNLKTSPPSDDEITTAKEYLKGKLTLKLEDSEEFAHMLARQELLKNEVETPETIIKKIDQVTLADITTFIETFFRQDNLYLALIGPYSDPDQFQKLLTL